MIKNEIVSPTEYRVGDYIFYIHPFGGDETLEIFGDLQKALVPVIGKTASGFGCMGKGESKDPENIDDLLDKKIDLATIGNAIANATQHLDGQELVRLSKKLRSAGKIFCLHKDDVGKDPEKLTEDDYKAITQGRPEIIFGLTKAIIEVNYKSFFGYLREASGGLSHWLALMKNEQQKQ